LRRDTCVDCRIDTEILDLLPDDQEAIHKRRSEYHWDKVSKQNTGFHFTNMLCFTRNALKLNLVLLLETQEVCEAAPGRKSNRQWKGQFWDMIIHNCEIVFDREACRLSAQYL
jgi:hypothetical protein